MTAAVTPMHPAPSRLAPARRLGAAIAAAAFFGAVAAAPLSLSGAFAADQAAAYRAPATQGLAVGSLAAPLIDLSTSEAAEAAAADGTPTGALYSLSDFMFQGAISWGGYKFTYYSQQVLPGEGLEIPGRHVNAAGYVSDSDGYIVLAGSAAKGTVYETPFGYQGKIYDRGTVGNHLDVYIQ